MVQYVFEDVEREVKVKPHGNSNVNKPYYRTSETTKQRFQQLAGSNSPKEVFHQSLEESGGILHLKSAGGHARDLKQVKNIKQKNQRNEGDDLEQGPEQGMENRDGAVVRALASHQCGPGSIPGPGVICGLSLLLFVVGSRPCSEGFSPGSPVFLPP